MPSNLRLRSALFQWHKLRNKVQVESNVMSFSQSKFEKLGGAFKLGSSLHRPTLACVLKRRMSPCARFSDLGGITCLATLSRTPGRRLPLPGGRVSNIDLTWNPTMMDLQPTGQALSADALKQPEQRP